MRLIYIILACITVGLSSFAYAQDTGTGVLKFPQDIEFRGPLSGPPEVVLLYGDPIKPGAFFVSRVRFAAGWKDPPHWYHAEERTVVVLSGTLYVGNGDKWDENKLRAYPAGTFLRLLLGGHSTTLADFEGHGIPKSSFSRQGGGSSSSLRLSR
jgi:hypothetical protein